jgi:16S rRNA C1402 N4-methylase RsmH
MRIELINYVNEQTAHCDPEQQNRLRQHAANIIFQGFGIVLDHEIPAAKQLLKIWLDAIEQLKEGAR